MERPWQRRDILTAAAAIGSVLPIARPARAFRALAGCCIAPAQFAQVRFANAPPAETPPSAEFDPRSGALLGRSGRGPEFDRALGRVLGMVAEVLEETPGFGFYDDGGGPNALASWVHRVPETWGTVVFGTSMLGLQLDRPGGDIAVAAICAHEFAHIHQFHTGMYDRLQRRLPGYCTELHADFLAGYFVWFLRQRRPSISLQGVGRAWEELGDGDFNRETTHGTSRQRVAAIEAGYFLARDEDGEPDVALATEEALAHVRRYGD
jgi:hypothetical protein